MRDEMLVADCMTRNVRTLGADTSVAEALEVLSEARIHRLPVIDETGALLGIVSDMDLRLAEAAGRLADPVRAVMTKRVVTISEFCPVEEAAAVMRERQVGGLPVMRGDRLIGIITDGDIFDALTQLLGGGQTGLRVTLTLPEGHLGLPELLTEIASRGGRTVSVGTIAREQDCLVVLKVAGLSREQLIRATADLGLEIADLTAEE
jgi:acetoin utilization protein AcuB